MVRREPVEDRDRSRRGEWQPNGPDIFDHGIDDRREMFRRALGDEAYLRLLESYGGCRLAVPFDPARSKLSHAIGIDAARKMAAAFGGDYITIPLDRPFRAIALRERGHSARQIALALGVTENGVSRLFWRLRDAEKRNVRK